MTRPWKKHRSQNAHALRNEVDRARIELDRYRSTQGQKDWFVDAERLLGEAEGVLETRGWNRFEVHSGWSFALEARQRLIHGLDATGLSAKAVALREEIESEVDDWRRKPAIELLGRAEKEAAAGRLDDGAQFVEEAMRLRDEHTQKLYRDALALSARVERLSVFTGIVTTLLAIGLSAWRFDEERSAVLAAAFGLLGGSISAYSPVTGRTKRFAEQWSAWFRAIARPFIGAAAALAVYPFARAGIVPVAKDSLYALAAVSVAAGFSERVLWRALATVPGSTDAVGDKGERA